MTERPELVPREWRIDGYPIRGSLMQTWERLDWSRAYEDRGPSPAGNPGPYWHVAEILDDDEIWHRLYHAYPVATHKR